MSADLTPVEAFLSIAAADTRAEMHAARLALISSGAGMLKGLDTTDLVSGDGTAGRSLLGGTGNPLHDHLSQRAARLQVRLFARLARTTVSTDRAGHPVAFAVRDETGGAS
ncbi:hypothetical protein N866_07025 [Actinotalea ferrariae CF5-4]|uniref:Uncharacterized protein n=1 Tax=Actinotalea ferrariae CF5-4 TaxID=948458 RepID=A0A021W007_9CELL|nr:hypothetical protein [Actinotalea ferrariae]EYR64657.1 hypothetical protein N866_07025 [Actinotalea ferrariae CF5-4]